MRNVRIPLKIGENADFFITLNNDGIMYLSYLSNSLNCLLF